MGSEIVLPGAVDWDGELWPVGVEFLGNAAVAFLFCLHSDLLKYFSMVCNALRLSFLQVLLLMLPF